MSRYIDADALMQNIPNEEMIAKMAVAHAPSIDIVRCKECEYWDRERAKRNGIQFKGYCTMHIGYCDGDKYCAWGERDE